MDDRLDSDSESFQMEFGIRSVFAREERKRISDRVKRAKQSLKASGKSRAELHPLAGSRCSNPDGPGGVLTPIEQEQEAVRAAA